MSVRDVIVMVTAFSTHFHLTNEAQMELIEILKICSGSKSSDLNISKYKMQKCFPSQDENITQNYYCSNCSDNILYFLKATDKCVYKAYISEKCEKTMNHTIDSTNYFLSLGLVYQIKQLLKNNKIIYHLNSRIASPNETNDANLKDVYNSELYKK